MAVFLSSSADIRLYINSGIVHVYMYVKCFVHTKPLEAQIQPLHLWFHDGVFAIVFICFHFAGTEVTQATGSLPCRPPSNSTSTTSGKFLDS